jgi:hypothetical protein
LDDYNINTDIIFGPIVSGSSSLSVFRPIRFGIADGFVAPAETLSDTFVRLPKRPSYQEGREGIISEVSRSREAAQSETFPESSSPGGLSRALQVSSLANHLGPIISSQDPTFRSLPEYRSFVDLIKCSASHSRLAFKLASQCLLDWCRVVYRFFFLWNSDDV